ncbi:ribokinase [Epibacterium sp. SM1979]|uniref:Ribokinase n=1 Tax=Tritonibacter litoralis TaxID=2662264 RepID=A0A843YFH5_9RHOB|nr:ribokinase [Tritonibacter litoralis]MQQ08224.1 ribokinase [Tritonibacter litoralis]
MAIWNLGSINLDLVYSLSHFPAAGETLAAQAFHRYLGGKGANMSVAGARAGATVHHIGAVGTDGAEMVGKLTDTGVKTDHIAKVPVATGHAVISVVAGTDGDAGENQIILFPGANQTLTKAQVAQALDGAKAGDIFVTQNETNMQVEACRMAAEKGLRVCYAAAPFDADAVAAVLPYLDFLILNEVEAAQLAEATGQQPEALGVRDVIITLGSKGARHIDCTTGQTHDVKAFRVEPVDTTGAGDTFTGYVLAGLDQGQSMAEAMETANRAGAVMVTRHGTSDVIPTLAEVNAADLT